MALQFRKVREADRLTITPVAGEPIYTIDTKKLYIGDGVTVGGVNVVSNVTIQDYLNVDIDTDELEDGSFIYYVADEDRWHIGKPVINITELDDITSPSEIDTDFMLVYDQSIGKWVTQEPLAKTVGDVSEFSVAGSLTVDSILEYNEQTEKFESNPLPPKPAIGDLIRVNTVDAERGHLLFYRGSEEGFVSDWINSGLANPYYGNLHGLQDLDVIKWNDTTQRFERFSPSLVEADLIALEGLNEPEPEDIVFTVTLSENGRFAIDTATAPALSLYSNRNYIFDLSDPSLIGKTFQVSKILDGIHSIDPPGEIYVNNRFIATGTPGIDGEFKIDTRTSGLDIFFSNLYYFCVEEPEMGNTLQFNLGDFPLKPFVMQWDADLETFDAKRFAYGLNDFGNIEFTYDPEIGLSDYQMLAWDAGNQTWNTPPDRVAGVGIGGGLPRMFNLYSAAMWRGGVEGLGTFDLDLKDGQMLKSIKINLDELEIEGEEEEFDAYFFDTEEAREEWQKAVEEAEAALGPGGVLSREAIDELVSQYKGKKARLQSNKKEYTRTGRSVAARGNIEVGGSKVGGSGAMGGFDFGAWGDIGAFDLSGLGGGAGGIGSELGKDEPGLDALTSPIPDLEEQAEEFRKAYKDFGKNLKKVFGAVMAKRRALKAILPEAFGGSGGGGLQLEFEIVDPVSDPVPPTMFGWRASTDVYGYYYFTYTERSSVLTNNTRDHYLLVQSSMRRCGCVLSRGSTFRVVFYYDADDSRYMSGEWLRIIEFQRVVSPYTGDLQELPSTTIRGELGEWDPGVTYTKGNRVIYNDKVWELIVDESEASPPASGTTLAPSYVTEGKVEMFVEIPRFSVKSQLFEGVYQLRCTPGKDTEGGKTHPVFNFGTPDDDADYLYVACNLMDQNGNISSLQPIGSSPSAYKNMRIDTKTGQKQFINSQNLDLGVFMYDMNVHSALQHLMVQEFQTFNVEQKLGESRLAPTQSQYNRELIFALDCGNASAATQENDPNENPAGIISYRGIHRPYGNQGYFIDGININSLDGSAYINKDSNTHSDGLISPPGYILIDKVPKPSLDGQGTGSGFISNFHTWKSQAYTDFVYMLPKSIGGSRSNFLGDTIKFRNAPLTSSVLTVSTGSPFQNPINFINGGNGPFNLNLQPLNGSNHIFGARVCVKRRGTSLTMQKEKIGEKELGTVFNAQGIPVATNVEQSTAQPGETWVLEKTVDVFTTVPGNDRLSGDAGTSTTSLGRQLASKSAICIAVIDESDSGNSLFRNVEFSEKFKKFRELYPNRQHWLLMPATSNPEFTKPFPVSQLENNSFEFFPNVDPVRPISRNQRTSDNLTYRVDRAIDWAGRGFIPDPEAFREQSDAIAAIAANYRYARFKGYKYKETLGGAYPIIEESQVVTNWYNLEYDQGHHYLQLGGLKGCVIGCLDTDQNPIIYYNSFHGPAIGEIPWRSGVRAYQWSGCGGGDLALGAVGISNDGCACYFQDGTGHQFACSPVGTTWETIGVWEFSNEEGSERQPQAESPAWDMAPRIGSWHQKLKDYGVWTYDPWNGWIKTPQWVGGGSELAEYQETTLEPNYTYRINYKIRIPRQIPLLAFEFTGANEVTVELRHPVLNNAQPVVVGTHADPSTVKQVQIVSDHPAAPILTGAARGAVVDGDDWYDLIVKVKNTTEETQYWRNPMAYYLRITGGNLLGSEWNDTVIFDAYDYATIHSDIYSPKLIDNAETPISYMRDAHLGEENHGPYIITRDNGSTSSATDWFKLCKLDSVSSGSIVGLFVDTSGSMTLNTVGASYALFYQRCAENGLQISEVQNSNEDWILPFIDEI